MADIESAVEHLSEFADELSLRSDMIGNSIARVHGERLRLILSANREMRKALEFYADEPAREFPSDGPWGVNSDDFGRVARSALTTQRGG